MNSKIINLFALAALTAVPVLAAETQMPNADQLLRQMSKKLADSKNFSFQATREIDAALLQGRDIAEKATVFAAVQRPNKLAAKSVSKGDIRRFVADGNTLTLFDESRNHFAVVPMRTTLDGLVEQVDKHYGFTPPLAEFALSNPYQDLRRQATTITYLGRGKTNEGFLGMFGVECHRLWLAGKVADAELWIGVNDLLPHKMIATFHREGKPQVRIAFSNWNLAAATPASEFSFTPPKGAQKIEMWTTAKMQSAGKR